MGFDIVQKSPELFLEIKH